MVWSHYHLLSINIDFVFFLRNFKSELFAFSQRLNENLSEENLKIAFTNESYIQKEEKQRKELGIIDVAINIIDNNNFATVGETICKSYIKPYLRHFLPRLPEDGIMYSITTQLHNKNFN